MDFTEIFKFTTSELPKFVKETGPRFAVLSDLKAARDACKTKEAKKMIGQMAFAFEKELRSECDAFNAKIGAVWKKAKGEKMPAKIEKKIQTLVKKEEKSLKSAGAPKPAVQYGESISLNFAKGDW